MGEASSTDEALAVAIKPRSKRRRSLGQEIRRQHAIRSALLTTWLVVGALVVVACSVFIARASAAYEGAPLITRTK